MFAFAPHTICVLCHLPGSHCVIEFASLPVYQRILTGNTCLSLDIRNSKSWCLEKLRKTWKHSTAKTNLYQNVTDDYFKRNMLTRSNTAASPQMKSAFQAPFLLSSCFWRWGPTQYCVCALSDTLAVGNEPSDGEWLPTRAECHYE